MVLKIEKNGRDRKYKKMININDSKISKYDMSKLKKNFNFYYSRIDKIVWLF